MDLERRIRVGLQRFQQTPAEPTINEENEEEPASGKLKSKNKKNKQISFQKFVCQNQTKQKKKERFWFDSKKAKQNKILK